MNQSASHERRDHGSDYGPTGYGLTRRQRDLLDFVKACEAAGRGPPSFSEMARALNLKSKQGVHRLVDGLEARGAIRRLRHRARSIRVVREVGAPLPEAAPGEPMQAEIVELVNEAKRHAREMLGAADGQCTAHVLALWLWCALHGTSPGFLPREDVPPKPGCMKEA